MVELGTMVVVKAYYLNGVKQENGTYSATTHPELFTGDGELIVDPTLELPEAPADLTATDVRHNQVSISWTMIGDNADGYVILDLWGVVDTVEVDTFTFTGLLAETTYEFEVYAYNLLGNSETVSIEVTTAEAPVGIKPDQVHDIRIYPNPVADILHLEGADGLNWELFNLKGHLLKQGRTSQIETAGLTPGGYVLRVERSDGEPVLLRFLKE
jgi:hypothetical protein